MRNILEKQRKINITEEYLKKYELMIKKTWEQGKIHAPVHLSGGNEKQVMEIFQYIRKDDYVFSTWRSHFHYLCHVGIKGEKWLTNEILKGRSISICNPKYNFFSTAIVNGNLSIALGVACALKKEKNDNKMVFCMVGDMASESGVFHEATKYAIRQNLNIQFCIENNGKSTNTDTQKTWGLNNLNNEKFQVCRDPSNWELLNNNKNSVYIHPDYNGKVFYYQYERIYPHQGIGHKITFF